MARRDTRREEALSLEVIVAAAIGILDAGGEDALTFRALASRLATGSGAIYWHVADKGELLAAAVERVVAGALLAVDEAADARGTIRATAIALFDAIDAHPWAGAQLNREPWRPGSLRMYERLGRAVCALGVPVDAKFDAWSALLNYTLGVAGQNAANARLLGERDRDAFLDDVAG